MAEDRRALRAGLLLVALGVLAQTFYAMRLNTLLYARTGPFYDSMAYLHDYATVLAVSRDEGVLAGLKLALHVGTVSLPWIFTALFSPVLPWSRHAGIWFQEIWMLSLGWSVFLYLARYRRLPAARAFCLTLPFLAFRAVFAANGGVSDFRMDLMLYLLLSNMAVWYLATYETASWGPWAASGLFLLLAILNRATAPVYMAVMFGPLLAARIFFGSRAERIRLATRLLTWWGPPAVAGSLALLANFEGLHDYYFVWGADPNANLPLSRSYLHVLLAGFSIGIPLTLAAVSALLLQVWDRRREFGRNWGKWAKALHWRVLWLGTAPVLMLVLMGAGLNPFVSMPAVFGWLLFCWLPFEKDTSGSSLGRNVTAALAVAACLANVALGYRMHLDPPGLAPTMPALRRAVELMRDDTLSAGRTLARFVTVHIADFDAVALRSVLVFEYGARPRNNALTYGGVTFRPEDTVAFGTAVPVAWERDVAGRNDEEKLATLVSLASRDLDYIFLPDARSLDWMEKNRAFNFANTKARAVKTRVLRDRGMGTAGRAAGGVAERDRAALPEAEVAADALREVRVSTDAGRELSSYISAWRKRSHGRHFDGRHGHDGSGLGSGGRRRRPRLSCAQRRSRDRLSRDQGRGPRQDCRRAGDRQPRHGPQRSAPEVLLALARQGGLRPGVRLPDPGDARRLPPARAAIPASRSAAERVVPGRPAALRAASLFRRALSRARPRRVPPSASARSSTARSRRWPGRRRARGGTT